MRLILLSVFVILGANLMIDMLDSDMTEILNERKETIERFREFNN